jgi:hypothetical protein
VFTDSAGMTLAYARSRCVRKMLAICADRRQPGSDHIVWRICCSPAHRIVEDKEYEITNDGTDVHDRRRRIRRTVQIRLSIRRVVSGKAGREGPVGHVSFHFRLYTVRVQSLDMHKMSRRLVHEGFVRNVRSEMHNATQERVGVNSHGANSHAMRTEKPTAVKPILRWTITRRYIMVRELS